MEHKKKKKKLEKGKGKLKVRIVGGFPVSAGWKPKQKTGPPSDIQGAMSRAEKRRGGFANTLLIPPGSPLTKKGRQLSFTDSAGKQRNINVGEKGFKSEKTGRGTLIHFTPKEKLDTPFDPLVPEEILPKEIPEAEKLKEKILPPSEMLKPTGEKSVQEQFREMARGKEGIEKFIGKNINPAMASILEFLGAEFQMGEGGKLTLTKKGMKGIVKGAAITGATSAIGGIVATKVLSKIAGSSVGKAAGLSSTARITRQKMAHEYVEIIAGSGRTAKTGLYARGTIQTQRAFIGKPAKTGVSKLFSLGGNAAKRAPVAARFATNTKSTGLTSRMLEKFGLTLAATAAFIGIVGTYPFAGFIKEEAAQASSRAFDIAFWNNDRAGMEEALKISEEMLNPNFIRQLLSAIPFTNILEEVNSYMKAFRIQTENQRKVFEEQF